MDAPTACHSFHGHVEECGTCVIEMQMHFATDYATPLLNVPTGQGNNHVVDKVYRCERCALRQQAHDHEFLPVGEARQY
jgi:hypothetical protein